MARQRIGDLTGLSRGQGFGEPTPIGPSTPNIILCKVAVAPESASSTLVLTPLLSYTNLQAINVIPGRWNASVLPAVGTLVPVIFDEENDAWVPFCFPQSDLYLPVSARAWGSTAQSIPANTSTKVLLNEASFDTTDGQLDVTTHFRFNVAVAGCYQVNGAVVADLSAAGELFAEIYKNGGLESLGSTASLTSSGNIGASVSDVVQCSPGDYLELWIEATEAATLIGLNPQFNYLSVARVA